MGTTVREEYERRLVPAGVHRAACCWVIDLGTVTSVFQGRSKVQSKVLIGWELADVRVTIPASEKGPERTYLQKVSHAYTASLDERATLRQHLDAWRGRPFTKEEVKGFPLKAILGAPCLLQIMHEESGGKTYANITAIMSLPAGTPRPTLEAAPAFFDMDLKTPLPADLPSWLVDKIAQSPEWAERYAAPESTDFYFGCAPPEGATETPAAPAALTPPPPEAPPETTGLEEAIMEGEIRRLAVALGVRGPAFEVRLGTARRHHTLPDMLATYREMIPAPATEPTGVTA